MTATVNYGDSTGVQALSVSQSSPNPGSLATSLNHRYADNGTFIVTVTVMNKDMGMRATTATVVVSNARRKYFRPTRLRRWLAARPASCASFSDQARPRRGRQR